MSSQQPIGLLFNGVWSHYTFAKAPKYRELYRLIYIHDWSEEDMEGLQALVIPFQSNHQAIAEKKGLIFDLLARGGKVFVEGDSSIDWLPGQWEDRPVNNYWWVKEPNNPPISETNYDHPIYQGLKARHACWHTHGVYTAIPEHAEVIQTNAEKEVISWETTHFGGHLFATTLDPIVEHGVQQITHLDNYVDRLTAWLCGVKPEGSFTLLREDYGVRY